MMVCWVHVCFTMAKVVVEKKSAEMVLMMVVNGWRGCCFGSMVIGEKIMFVVKDIYLSLSSNISRICMRSMLLWPAKILGQLQPREHGGVIPDTRNIFNPTIKN
jgi:hypothetical protein